MKFKNLLSVAVALSAIFFITSCDDDIDSIGQSIQPDIDDIQMKMGEIPLTIRTVRMPDENNKGLFVKGDRVMLGELNDPVFGKIKADFLTDFYTANETFELGYNDEAIVDSVKLHMAYPNYGFTGDSLSPIGVTVYEVNKRSLKVDYYTNIDPAEYSDKKVVLGQRFFSPVDLTSLSGGKMLSIDLNKKYGDKLYQEWKTNPKVLTSAAELRKVLKGIYVTSDFNDKAIIGFEDINSSISMNVHYSYKIKKEDDSDSTVVRSIFFPVGKEAYRLNRVINTPAEEIDGFEDSNTDRTFVKSPSNVITEVTIPLGKIRRQAIEATGENDKFIINTASFKLLGFTEEEDKLNITSRPERLLFIHQDSLKGFLDTEKTSKVTGTTTRVLLRDGANNSYNFSSYNSTQAISNNIASLVNYYIKEAPEDENVIFYIIPIGVTVNTGSQMLPITSVNHLYTPTSAIFRTKDEFMKMSMIYSKYNEIK